MGPRGRELTAFFPGSSWLESSKGPGHCQELPGIRWRPEIGRGGQDRTADLLVPNQAPYRWATPRTIAAFARPKGQRNKGRGLEGERTWVMVPPERVELSSLAPEASTLSTELRGRTTN